MNFDLEQLKRITESRAKAGVKEVAPSAQEKADAGSAGASSADGNSAAPFYATQDQTSLYEEYLFGRATYADGGRNKTWSDSTKGRVAVRLVSRGVFGALAFSWGSRVSARQLQNYNPETYRFTLKGVREKPLQAIAKSFDTVIATPIKASVRKMAPAEKAQEVANRAVRFRQKAYFHSKAGETPGRSLGAEMVAVTFDFASASTADATMRSVIQLADPNIEKPWLKDDKFDAKEGAKSFGKTAWRIFSKNQGEDWAAALPYIYQMKFQRQAIAKIKGFAGFKLGSDHNLNGAGLIVNRAGKLSGDYHKAGALDLQMRFMGYNWYTLIYREMYDSIRDGWHKWRNGEAKFEDIDWQHPISNTATNLAHGARYVVKSAVKSGLYMLPSVPAFWLFRVPQTKWRVPLVAEQPAEPFINAEGKEVPINSYVMREDANYSKHAKESHAFDAVEFHKNTTEASNVILPGGIHTNDGKRISKAYMAERMPDGTVVNRRVKLPELGGDAVYKLKNQTSLFGKILNPFGWVSYKAGSGVVKIGDALAKTGRFGKLFSGSPLDREMFLRGATDASFSYTPYMIAKTEFGLRVDDRGAGRETGEMDKAIYKGIDSLVTFDMAGLNKATHQIGQLLFNRKNADEDQGFDFDKAAEKIEKNKGGASSEAQKPRPVIQAETVNIPALKSNTKTALAHPKITQPEPGKKWEDKLQSKEHGQTFLYPESRTVQ